MGADARGIGRANAWPCVGDPDTWESAGDWMNCPAEGSLSLMALVPAGSVAHDQADDDEPAVVVLSVCPEHVRAARRWLQRKTPDDVDTYSTPMLLEHMGQVQSMMGATPILRMVRSA